LVFLTVREEHRLSVFENRVLRRIFGPERQEVTGKNCIMRGFIIVLIIMHYWGTW
jgi:hypothetical protein